MLLKYDVIPKVVNHEVLHKVCWHWHLTDMFQPGCRCLLVCDKGTLPSATA